MACDIHDNIEIKIVNRAEKKELEQLYKEAGWWESSDDQDKSFLSDIVKGSALFAGAFHQKKMIGMGRVFSDLASDAYIQDVTVLKAYRGNGIGRKIIQLLVKELKQNNVGWIGLVAEPGTSLFYEQLGFEQLKDHVPFRYKGS